MFSYYPNTLIRTFFVFIVVFLEIISLNSCSDIQKETKSTSAKVIIKQSFKDKVEKKNSENYMLLENTCLYCHKIENITEQDDAPSMQVIRDVYKSNYPSKPDFINALVVFTINPSKDLTIMQSAIDQYGLMQDAGHTKADVEDIAAYLFDYKF